MHDDADRIQRRLERALRQRLRPAVYGPGTPLKVEAWAAPGEPVPAAEALKAEYAPIEVGQPWGTPWSTWWFRLTGEVPPTTDGERGEIVVDLGFGGTPGFSAEGLLHTKEGRPVRGLHPRQIGVPLDLLGVREGQPIEVYVEAAANPEVVGGDRPFAPTELGSGLLPDADPLYVLRRAEVAGRRLDVWHLVLDLDVLDELQQTLAPNDARRREILRAIDRALDRVDAEDVASTAAAARAELADVLGRPANASAHRISAVGHAHIDCAWLWPLREARRKVTRTVANVLALADDYPELVFAFSSAQQHAWVQEDQPELWERITKAVAEGVVVPVGGMWVESDTNLPGGESLVRQLVHGKRFFLEQYGVDTPEVWLPDSFGYTAALPQLVALSGSRWFLTQKISWNNENRFPHHTFWFEGIDGTRVFTHFPPVDTYTSYLTGQELAHAAANFAESGAATRSLIPFGYGDGGGGPVAEFMERAARVRDLEGSPRVTIESPTAFFAAAEAEYADAPVWSGELYLEKHRGTYTSQLRTKQGNRRAEHLLREVELWSATAVVTGALTDYPYDELDRIWKVVLLHQFHDILPGSSIGWVHREAQETYRRVLAELEALVARAQQALAGGGDEHELTFNAAPHGWDGVPALGAGPTAPPEGTATATDRVLDNGLIRVAFDDNGLIVSIKDLAADRELLTPGRPANLLQLHPDTPAAWDAWDLDPDYRHTGTDLTELDSLDLAVEDGTATAVVRRRFGRDDRSSIAQTLRLAPGSHTLDVECEIDWQESERILKVAWPFDLHADHTASEIQFGHLKRPTHQNTSWDAARFEFVAQRWVHVGEPDYGVALVNDSTYGYDAGRTTNDDGSTTTTVRLSLLRAPQFPEPHTDAGLHRLSYGVVVGAGIGDAVREGYRANLALRTVRGSTERVAPLVEVASDDVVVEAVKLADDRSGDVVVRMYESRGNRTRTRLTASHRVTSATEVDLLERPLRVLEPGDNAVDLKLRPFQVLTLRLVLKDRDPQAEYARR